MRTPEADGPSKPAHQDIIEAIDLLDCLEARELAASSWDHVALILSSMYHAIDRGDATAFETVVSDLEVLSLERVSRAGPSVAPAPDQVIATALILSSSLKSTRNRLSALSTPRANDK
jgi:hypothetical protein